MLSSDVANGCLGVEYGRLGIRQIRHDDGTTLLDVAVLFDEGGLDFDRRGLLLLCLLLICHHTLELLICLGILGLKLRALDGQTLA